jgi:integrase/recombinase XerD
MKLAQSINAYVEGRRSYGALYPSGIPTLQAFCRFAGDIRLDRIRPGQVTAFLDGRRTSQVTWQAKYKILQSFFLYWVARNAVKRLPMPVRRAPVESPFVPYIYTRAEIRHLLSMIRIAQKNGHCKIDARTVRAFILFLYGTGAMVNEALALRPEDVDFKKRTITIRSWRPYRSRTIPICRDLHGVLYRYDATYRRKGKARAPEFFLQKNGEALTAYLVGYTFRRLLEVAGVRRRDGTHYRPRLYDLRHTFAVHRMAAWIKHHADMNRMVPALSVYIGQLGLGSSDRYLTLTPERFRAQLNKLSPRRGKRHWRDNPALMKFLGKL